MSKHHEILNAASEQLKLAGDVIEQLAKYAGDLERKLAARDVAIKLASYGKVPLAELSEKVAELERKEMEELAMEEKLASYVGDTPGHGIADSDLGASSGVSLLDLIS